MVDIGQANVVATARGTADVAAQQIIGAIGVDIAPSGTNMLKESYDFISSIVMDQGSPTS
jgi:hypothetical protein